MIGNVEGDVSVDLRGFELELSRPLRTAAGRMDSRRGWVVLLEADGHVGVGEATPLPGWTEPIHECRTALRTARDAVSDDGWPAALRALEDTPAARNGLVGARMDRDARAAGIPLVEHLGGRPDVGPVPVNATVDDADADATVAAAERAVERGHGTIKCKVGAADHRTDGARMAAVRSAIGPEVALRLDANGAWSTDEAERALDALEEVDPEYVEQPVPGEDVSGLARLAGTSEVDIAADEALAVSGPEPVLRAGAADVLVCKPMVLGGPDQVLAVARRADESGVAVTVTTTIDGAIARTTALHVAAAVAPGRAHGLATGDRLETDLAETPTVEAGKLPVPDGPGIGIDPIEAMEGTDAVS